MALAEESFAAIGKFEDTTECDQINADIEATIAARLGSLQVMRLASLTM